MQVFKNPKSFTLESILYLTDHAQALRIRIKHEGYTVFDIERESAKSIIKELSKLNKNILKDILLSEVIEIYTSTEGVLVFSCMIFNEKKARGVVDLERY